MRHDERKNEREEGTPVADPWSWVPFFERESGEPQEERFWQEVEITCVHEETTHLDFALEPVSFVQGARVFDQRLLMKRRATGEPVLFVAALLALDALPPRLRAHMPVREQAQPGRWLLAAPNLQQAWMAEERQPAGHLLSRYLVLDPHVLCPARTMLSSCAVPLLLIHAILVPANQNAKGMRKPHPGERTKSRQDERECV